MTIHAKNAEFGFTVSSVINQSMFNAARRRYRPMIRLCHAFLNQDMAVTVIREDSMEITQTTVRPPYKRAFAHQARIPVELLNALEPIALSEGRSINNLIVSILREAVLGETEDK